MPTTPSVSSNSDHRTGPLPRARTSAPAIVFVLALCLAATALPAAAQSDAPASPPAGGSNELPARVVDEVEAVIRRAGELRRLPLADGVVYRVLDKSTARDELERDFRDENSDAWVAAEDDAYTRLGLLGPDDDLAELWLSLYEAQILAFYDPETKTFSLIGPIDRIGPFESVVVAHEYGHALQDAAWDIEGTRVTDLTRADRIIAEQALVEGDASLLMADWVASELSPLQMLQFAGSALVGQDLEVLEAVPPILRRQLEFPYVDGLGFVTALRAEGDWEAVDDAWEARPVSSEQILHPELYPDELPTDVVLPDIASVLGDGWHTAYEQTLGELQIGVWVDPAAVDRSLLAQAFGGPARPAAAAGWAGDRLASVDGPGGAWVIVWQTDWDSATDAHEFEDAASAVAAGLDGVSTVSDSDIVGGLSSPVLVLVADSASTLEAVGAALDLDS